MAIVYLSMGSNLGDRKANMETAVEMIAEVLCSPVLNSGIYETQAWGYDGRNFLNMVIKASTSLEPHSLLISLKNIETGMGRVKSGEGYADRMIDIDILFYGREVYKSDNLIIPHPGIPKRLFVLVPLKDIALDFVHPVLNKSVEELLKECPDKGWIKKFEE